MTNPVEYMFYCHVPYGLFSALPRGWHDQDFQNHRHLLLPAGLADGDHGCGALISLLRVRAVLGQERGLGRQRPQVEDLLRHERRRRQVGQQTDRELHGDHGYFRRHLVYISYESTITEQLISFHAIVDKILDLTVYSVLLNLLNRICTERFSSIGYVMLTFDMGSFLELDDLRFS